MFARIRLLTNKRYAEQILWEYATLVREVGKNDFWAEAIEKQAVSLREASTFREILEVKKRVRMMWRGSGSLADVPLPTEVIRESPSKEALLSREFFKYFIAI
ncbi:hypothetical protein BK816_01170 [Boudabousia tangfeifanii]|uniref:Uncharacterized protein n=1 Tax=Boudabousia tangfeifanii TaxID=1912795 RepID=A0A1D9MIH5_9ACTO|nr:hypothetical protein [Boudabousia tangfeifanii]AOZ72076.1 hypothetical protein BK816_01170 [Boudabousia tangfeifanii]